MAAESPGHHKDHPYHVSRILAGVALGGIAVAGAVILAPHVLPAIGIGSVDMAEESMYILHTSVEAGGTGVAGAINGVLASVPFIGEKLAEGGLFNAAITGTVGIGGVLLGNYIARREDGSKRIKWGNVIRTAALITSAIVALPTVLTAIGTGLIYLSTLAGNVDFANNVISIVDKTVGTAGTMEKVLSGFSGVAAVVPHFLTCGVSLLPAVLSLGLWNHHRHEKESFAARVANVPSAEKYSDGSIALDIKTAEPMEAHKPCQAVLTLRDKRTGALLAPEDLAVVHTKKLHLFVVDQSLKDYHHIHPHPTGAPGEMAFTFTPNTAHTYSAWADFTTLRDEKNHKLQAALPALKNLPVKPSIKMGRHAELAGLQFDWKTPDPLEAGKAAIVEVTVTDAHGRPATNLEPVMGAFAHMVGFSADGNSIVHCHPLGREPTSENERGGPTLRFHVEPDVSGPMQFYVQVKQNGNDIYAPFGQRIQSPANAVERVAQSRLSAAHAHPSL